MRFTSAHFVEQAVWDLRLADYPRGKNRALVERLFNGLPPYTTDEAEQDQVDNNINFLEGSRLAADARRSYYNAFLKPGRYFNVSLDYGPVHKRSRWANIITREWNKAMKGNPEYFEFLRSQFAQDVLHGIGPGFWIDDEMWCPQPVGVEDVMIPSGTLCTLKNLQYFAVFRQWTAMELYKMTHGPKVDKAWDMPTVEAALKWADEQTMAEIGYNDLYQPQKVEERWKQDMGFYGTDAVPTIDAWDFYFWTDENGEAGWRRRIILDTPTSDQVGTRKMPALNLIKKEHGHFLYNPGDNRIFAPSVGQILHFQFADATASAPFRYHSVRGLGWLLYAVCHLSNRLRCRVTDAIFENTLQYFRAANPEDKERVTKLNLRNFGVIPEGINFVKQEERWKVDQNLVILGLEQNEKLMNESAAQYREGRQQTPDSREKTATEIMAEVNSANALIGAMLLQAYEYHRYQGQEIARRFCRKDSKDPDVRRFRNNVLKAGVPEEVLDSSTWNIEPERVLGSGNKTLEIAMADKLMASRPLHDPESQREILHIYDMANSDNPDLADRLVPSNKGEVTDSVHDAQLMLGTLMLGMPMKPRKGQNAIEIIETLLAGMTQIMAPIGAGQEKPSQEKLMGLQTVARTIALYIAMLAQDKAEKERVRKYGDALGKIVKLLSQMGQAIQPEQAGGNGADPKDLAKADAIKMQAATKAQATAQSHAQRTQQRDVQFRMQMQQDAERHDAEMKKKLAETKVSAAATDIKTASEIKKNRLKALQE